MGSQPAPQQRPEPFERVDVHLAEPVPVVIPSELARRMADGVVRIAPLRQPAVDVVLVGVDFRSRGDRPLDQRADRPLLDVGQHPDDERAAPLDHPEDRRLLLRRCPPAGCPARPPATADSPFFATAAGWPLCPATTYTSSHSTSPPSCTSGLRATMPSRSCEAMTWASSGSIPSSWAICSLDRLSPMK